MAVTELDIFRAAKVLIRKHGDDAAIEAAMWADAMLDQGDLHGAGGVEADHPGD